MVRKRTLDSIGADELKDMLAPAAAALPSARPAARPIAAAPEILPPLPPALQTIDDFVAAISVEWENAQQRFLRIGDLLDGAEKRLARPDYLALVERLPFGKSTRSQLLTAYRAIRTERVPPQVAAAGYSTVYQLASMGDEARKKAAQAGLMRPDVRYAEVKAFVRDLRDGSAAPSKAMLEAKLKRLLAEVEEVKRQLAGLSA